MTHSITLEEAVKMTHRFRESREQILKTQYTGQNILPLAEKFDIESIRQITENPDCKALRIYMGMKEDMTIHSILVGVNEEDEDMLPQLSSLSETSGMGDVILEDAWRCPSLCPKASPLNCD